MLLSSSIGKCLFLHFNTLFVAKATFTYLLYMLCIAFICLFICVIVTLIWIVRRNRKLRNMK